MSLKAFVLAAAALALAGCAPKPIPNSMPWDSPAAQERPGGDVVTNGHQAPERFDPDALQVPPREEGESQ